MAKMSNREFEDAKSFIMDRFRYGSGSKDEYIAYISRIIRLYDDGLECAKQLDKYQDKWTVSL